MRESMNVKKFYMSFIAKLRDDRKLEILVYSALILTAAIIFAATGGISCSGSMKSEEAAFGATEERLECILSRIAGAGKVSVMVSYSEASDSRGEILGVIVAAEGAGDGQVRSALRTAVTTALGIGPERVCVFPTE